MKRWMIPVLAATLLAGAASVTSRVRGALERAVDGEREAIARYDAFAAKAIEEGYPGVATLFRAAARGEAVHLERFIAAMKERGIEIPPENTYTPRVGSTAENLRTAALAEAAERDGSYREALAAAEESGDEALRKMFDHTRDTEVEHANLLHAASRDLDELKSPKTYYVCSHCGYTTDVELPLCALCRTRERPERVK